MKTKIITILIILNIITFSFFGYIFINSSKYNTPKYSQLEIYNALNYFRTTFTEMPPKYLQIQDIRAIYGKNTRIIYKNIDAYGKAFPPFNIVIISNNVPLNVFAKVYAHEIEHISFEFKEYLVEYNAIIKLWESNIQYLKYQAYLGVKTIFDARLGIRYNCTNLLVEYYLERGLND